MLGRGLFAHVEEVNGQAVKVIDVDMQREPHDWRAELAALEKLQGKSKNIVEVLQTELLLSKMEPEVKITMPKYEVTLEQLIYKWGKANFPPGSGWRNAMPLKRSREIALGAARGLQDLHSMGIIHRDIKPENIMFESMDGEPKLIDLGVAWVTGVSEKREPWGEKVLDVCTGEYKPPELLFGLRNYTSAVDLWALGCILARLWGVDCKVLFGPYKSDIALIAAQFRTLGVPQIDNVPSYRNTVAEGMIEGWMHSSAPEPVPPVFRADVGAGYRDVVMNLLDYEYTNRRTAKDLQLVLESLETTNA